MRVTLTFDSVSTDEMIRVLEVINDTADKDAYHNTFPPTEDKYATVRKMGQAWTIEKGPISRAQAVRIMEGMKSPYFPYEECVATIEEAS